MIIMADISRLHSLSPNFKKRLSGITTTVVNLTPRINTLGFSSAVLGPSLPDYVNKISYTDIFKLSQKPKGASHRVWHARRNTEMLFGIFLKSILRFPLKLVFTSASQKKLGWYKKWLLSHMDAVVATSEKTASYLPRHISSHVIHHGVDTTRFHPFTKTQDLWTKAALKTSLGLDPRQRYIGCFGRIRPLKGTDIFVDACVSLLTQHPQWSALIVGRITRQNQSYAQKIQQKIAEHNLSHRILFVDESTDIVSYYQCLDLFVAPQRYEGFGLTPLEAMACGVPVVATDVGAYRELVHANCGSICETDALDMASYIETYIVDDLKRENASQFARSYAVSCLDINNEAKSLIKLYSQLIQKG